MFEDWQTWTFFNGDWFDGNRPILGPRSHAFWLASSVFDGARAFEGVTPDLDLHCARLGRSAKAMLLNPTMETDAIVGLAREGVKKFSPGAALYIRPMYWAEAGDASSVAPDPASTRFCLTVHEAPFGSSSGIAITRSPFRKPHVDTAPLDAKAACLYPNHARALIEARARGFENCLLADLDGGVAELATANIFMARDGRLYTPAANGAFLNGITRQRVIALLAEDGVETVETKLTFDDFAGADEIFYVGNYSKVAPVRRYEARDLRPGPFYRRARRLYMDFAHSVRAPRAAA